MLLTSPCPRRFEVKVPHLPKRPGFQWVANCHSRPRIRWKTFGIKLASQTHPSNEKVYNNQKWYIKTPWGQDIWQTQKSVRKFYEILTTKCTTATTSAVSCDLVIAVEILMDQRLVLRPNQFCDPVTSVDETSMSTPSTVRFHVCFPDLFVFRFLMTSHPTMFTEKHKSSPQSNVAIAQKDPWQQLIATCYLEKNMRL